jgi:hypothetical protein
VMIAEKAADLILASAPPERRSALPLGSVEPYRLGRLMQNRTRWPS